MKEFSLNKNKQFVVILLFFAFALFYFFGGVTLNFANADSSAVEHFLPADNMQYKSLDNPIDVYSDDNVTAIASGNQKLTVYYNGKYTEIGGFTAIKQVKKFNDNTLLVSDFGSIYSISLTENFSKTELPEIGGNYFDVNKEYLIAAYSGTAKVYKINANKFNSSSSFSLDADKPVAINNKNEIFFYNSDGICKLSANKTSEKPTVLSTDVPSKMIADDNFIYYLTENQTFVTKLSLSDLTKTQLFVSDIDKSYDLGNLISPSGISFKNTNLLLTDTELDAVQEFEIKDDKLIFTGFAIASDKTAYNRSSKNALAIEYYNKKVAILDENKLLISNAQSDNPYDRENFDNYLKADTFNNNMPNSMALGKDTVLLSYNHEKNNGYLKILNLADGKISDKIDIFDCVIQEVCYQSGNYYVLLIRLEGVTHKETLVYRLAENENELTPKVLSSNFNATSMTVDVFGNVYLADGNGKVCFYEKDDNYSEKQLFTSSGIKKMTTDLGGVLYFLNDKGLNYYDGKTVIKVDITGPENGDKVKTFAMSFEDKNVYVLFDKKEYACKTDTMNNLALNEVFVSDNEFVTTAPTAKVDGLKIATVKSGANLYSVLREKDGDGFIYTGLTQKQKEYAHICNVKMSDKLTLSVLAGQNELVLVNLNELTLSESKQYDAPEKAYITTDVNAYYFPIILKDINEDNVDYKPINFALVNGNSVVRLPKSTVITPAFSVKFLTREQSGETLDIYYYFASFTVNGETSSGYIPVTFTVPVLSEDFAWNEYVIETVKKTDVYIDSSLTGDTIVSLSDGDKVIITEKNESICKVRIKINDGEYLEGFINASAIKNEAQITIRNILILIIVSVCILGTTLFLVLRKKNND